MPSDQELAAVREQARTRWDGAEGYAGLGERLLPAARSLVDACAVSAGQDVLDVAAGNGNAAALAAAEGAHVVASDFAAGQVERGRQRTQAEGLDVEWVVADVEELPFDDTSFDCVLSVFGAMFAPRPERAASELFRVVRPGGTVGMANWGPFGFQKDFFETLSRYRDEVPESVPSPLLWGDEGPLRERLEGLAGSIDLERHAIVWDFPSFEEMAMFFRSTGPVAPETPQDQLVELVRDLQAVVERHNERDDGSILIRAEYTQVVARKRG